MTVMIASLATRSALRASGPVQAGSRSSISNSSGSSGSRSSSRSSSRCSKSSSSSSIGVGGCSFSTSSSSSSSSSSNSYLLCLILLSLTLLCILDAHTPLCARGGGPHLRQQRTTCFNRAPAQRARAPPTRAPPAGPTALLLLHQHTRRPREVKVQHQLLPLRHQRPHVDLTPAAARRLTHVLEQRARAPPTRAPAALLSWQ